MSTPAESQKCLGNYVCPGQQLAGREKVGRKHCSLALVRTTLRHNLPPESLAVSGWGPSCRLWPESTRCLAPAPLRCADSSLPQECSWEPALRQSPPLARFILVQEELSHCPQPHIPRVAIVLIHLALLVQWIAVVSCFLVSSSRWRPHSKIPI